MFGRKRAVVAHESRVTGFLAQNLPGPSRLMIGSVVPKLIGPFLFSFQLDVHRLRHGGNNPVSFLHSQG